MSANSLQKPVVFILDVDGVMTDGTFYYSEDGKVLKKFGADDHDALSLLKPHMEIRFITGDKRGFSISSKRIVDDMHMQLDLVSTSKRIEWIREKYPLEQVIYMGDGVFDVLVFAEVAYSIAPANALAHIRAAADYVSPYAGANRAVADAAFHILDKFFDLKNIDEMRTYVSKASGQWAV